MLTKATVKQTIERLPDSFSIDELIDELVFVEKVQKGLQQSKEGNVISNEEAKKRLSMCIIGSTRKTHRLGNMRTMNSLACVKNATRDCIFLRTILENR